MPTLARVYRSNLKLEETTAYPCGTRCSFTQLIEVNVMINYFKSDRFDVGSPNLFLATALSFERQASRVSRELRTNLNKSAIRMALS